MLIEILPILPPIMNRDLSLEEKSGSNFIANATFVRGPKNQCNCKHECHGVEGFIYPLKIKIRET